MNVNFVQESPLLQELVQDFSDVDLEYVEQLLVAFIPMGITVLMHGLGMDMVRRCFKRFGQPLIKTPHKFRRAMFMVGIVGIMLATHFSEIYMWGIFYYMTDLLPSIKNAMFFSMEAYSTLGASNITLTGRWLGFDGFEAMTGMMMFGWSTALLAVVMSKFHSIDE